MLQTLCITNRKSFLNLALKFHPDKGGDEKIFQYVKDLVYERGIQEIK